MLPNCSAARFSNWRSRAVRLLLGVTMSASERDLEHAAQLQFVRARKAEQKTKVIQHALNLVLNCGVERFHLALSADDTVHWFELENRPKWPRRRALGLAHCP